MDYCFIHLLTGSVGSYWSFFYGDSRVFLAASPFYTALKRRGVPMEEPKRWQKGCVLCWLLEPEFSFKIFLTRPIELNGITKNQWMCVLYWLESKKYIYRNHLSEHGYGLTRRGQRWQKYYRRIDTEMVVPCWRTVVEESERRRRINWMNKN